MEEKSLLPGRMEAWDAESTPDGWVVSADDVKLWAENALRKCENLSDREAVAILRLEITALIDHCS